LHVDFGLAVPLLSIAGMRATLAMLLELAPASKVLYASDAHMIPDQFYLAARWARKLLGELLDQSIRDGELNAADADHVARSILQENARRLYRLG
jgi:predicted TIM-barrel fold metal-dependent hydrolase